MLSMETFNAFKNKKIMGVQAPIVCGGACLALILTVTAAFVVMSKKGGGGMGSLLGMIKGRGSSGGGGSLLEGLTKGPGGTKKPTQSDMSSSNQVRPREATGDSKSQGVMDDDEDDDDNVEGETDVADVFKGIKM